MEWEGNICTFMCMCKRKEGEVEDEERERERERELGRERERGWGVLLRVSCSLAPLLQGERSPPPESPRQWFLSS